MWDSYNLTSLKQSTRERHGHGASKRSQLKVTVPGNWQNILHSDDNKRELFTFLTVHVKSTHIRANC